MTTSRVFNLSLHRSGTQSFQAFCAQSGINCFHWPGVGFDHLSKPSLHEPDCNTVWTLYNFIIQSEPYTAFSDLPVPILYQNLLATYPEASFFLMLRSPSTWVKSVRAHTGHRGLDILEQLLYSKICNRIVTATSNLSDDELEGGYMKHSQDITNACSQGGRRFAVFNLTDSQVNEKLSAFMKLATVARFPDIDETKLHEKHLPEHLITGEWE